MSHSLFHRTDRRSKPGSKSGDQRSFSRSAMHVHPANNLSGSGLVKRGGIQL